MRSALIVSARCLECDWTESGDGPEWARVDRAANAHTTRPPKHATATSARYATTKEGKR